jgi:uncharacterized protein with HEPN domain
MRLEAQKYLHDIQLAADRIERFCSGRTFAQYLGDEILRSAVERQSGIIGEALSRLAKEDQDVAVAIPAFRSGENTFTVVRCLAAIAGAALEC